MLKFNKIWIIFSVSLWLVCCQGLFVLVQSSLGQKIVESTQGQLRQELDFSNFNFLARSIVDYTTSGSIRCAVLEKVSPEFTPVIDLRYMGQNCKVRALELKGTRFDVQLKSLNGDTYRFQFISNNPSFFDLALWGFRILGVLAITGIMLAMKYLAERRLIAYQAEVEVAHKVKKIAMQVSHDIRSPLAALKMAMEGVGNIPLDSRSMIDSSLQRINDIANDLLTREKESPAIFETRPEELASLIDSIILEKQTEFSNFSQVEITGDLNEGQGLMVKVNEVELKRVLSNLINNSVEALGKKGKGKVEVSLSRNDGDLLLTIKDNGKGIPADVISRLGQANVTYGKSDTQSGSGLGVYHAKTTIETLGGTFKIESQEGIGTEVIITLPVSANHKFYDYVYIEDDKILRLGWEKKAAQKKINLLTLKSTNEFQQYSEQISKSETHIYVDSDLGEGQTRGEDFVEWLHDQGYQHINLASAYDAKNFAQHDWLGFNGKNCPF